MKLNDVTFKVSVREPGNNNLTKHFQAAKGWDIDLSNGVVTIRKGDKARCSPMANVIDMEPVAK